MDIIGWSIEIEFQRFFFPRKSLILFKKIFLESMDLMMSEISEQKATSQGSFIDRRRMIFISMKSINT